jgi:hypothetical protein
MRIITPAPHFRDYYDGGMAYGQDTSATYVRAQRFEIADFRVQGEHEALVKHVHHDAAAYVKQEHRRDRATTSWWQSGGSERAQQGMLFFCGRAYPFLQATRWVSKKTATGYVSQDPVYMTSFDQKGFDPYCDNENSMRAPPFRQWLDENQSKADATINLHFNSPIVAYCLHDVGSSSISPDRKSCFVVNPSLQGLGFQHVIDPFTAFQDISMFVTGVLGQNLDPPAAMSDKEKIGSHGLHPTHAFRTVSPGKKKKKN